MIEISAQELQSIMLQSGAIGAYFGFLVGLTIAVFIIYLQRKKVSIFLKNLSEGKRKTKILEQFDEFKDLAEILTDETNTSFMRGTYHDMLEILKYYQRKFKQ